MKAIFFISILSCAIFAEVSGRKCYMCASNDSFSTCDESRKEVDCSAMLPLYSNLSCAKVSQKQLGIEEYAKRCLPTSWCDDTDRACKNSTADCKIYCCNSDLCNKGAAAPLISRILILTTVVLAIFAN